MEIINYEKYQKCEYKLHYAIICRQWDEVCNIIQSDKLTFNDIKTSLFKDTDITIERCFSKNMQFLKANKNKRHYERLVNLLGEEFLKINIDKSTDYDSKDFYNSKSVLEVFFDNNQPVLDVKFFEKQTLAAQQLKDNHATMVLDEVGTGKTVAGIYAMQYVIQSRLNEIPRNEKFPSAAIIIVCPYNKREDWNNDIRRQLGRGSIIVNQNENGGIIKKKSVNPNKPLIYIMGCNGGNNDDSRSALKESLKSFISRERNWDLVIIDECHNCTSNYWGIRADNVMLLTATPIVVNVDKVQKFSYYKSLMETILGGTDYCKKIDARKEIKPIEINIPQRDDIFVCNYKEDIFNVEINRKIRFVQCERIEKRQEWFQKLRYEKDFFTAIYADQDDYRLVEKMKENFKDNIENYKVDRNCKLEELKLIVKGEKKENSDYSAYINKSFIIFCELKDTVNMIYNYLSDLADENIFVAKKAGDNAEIKNHTNNPNIVIEKIKTHIRNSKSNRAIFITTGKSGGTGLNLGEFDVVIHYELPYTNNELEQRFGRIERADDLISNVSNDGERVTIENEMIFLVNSPVKSQRTTSLITEYESDFITNRMLYYSINKINIACKYMPIRNTVLFHPETIKRIIDDAKNNFERINKYIDSNEGRQIIKDFVRYKNDEENIINIIRSFTKILGENTSDINKINKCKSINEKINIMLSNVKSTGELNNYKEVLELYLKADYSKSINFEEFLDKAIEHFIWLKKSLKMFGVDLMIENEPNNGIDFEETEELNMDIDNDETQICVEEKNEKLSKNILEIIDMYKRKIVRDESYFSYMVKSAINCLNSDIKKQNTTGIFYIDCKGEFCNKLVSEFRSGK